LRPLRRLPRQARERAEQRGFVHAARLRDADDVIVVRDARPVEPRAHERDPGLEPDGRLGFERQAHRTHAVFAADLENQRQHRRVQMEMLVRVDVIERQPGRGESIELRANLARKLRAHGGQEEEPEPVADHRIAETAIRADERGNRLVRQRRRAVGKHEVQADAQARQAPRALNRIAGGGLAHHQARGGEHAVAMRALHRRIDARMQAEVVGREDECALRRQRHRLRPRVRARSGKIPRLRASAAS
jgi:hypothetical protein